VIGEFWLQHVEQGHRHCDKKLAGLVRLRRHTSVWSRYCQRNGRRVNDKFRRSHSVFSSWYTCGMTTVDLCWQQLWSDAKSNRRQYYYLKPQYFRSGGSECDNRIIGANFLIVFHSNSGSVLLSFRDTITGQTTDGRTTDRRWHASRIWPVRWDSKNWTSLFKLFLVQCYFTALVQRIFKHGEMKNNDSLNPDKELNSLIYTERLSILCHEIQNLQPFKISPVFLAHPIYCWKVGANCTEQLQNSRIHIGPKRVYCRK